jgi:hypothetical protein
MPNWCNTEYILRGRKKDLKACAQMINKFVWGNYPKEDRKYSIYQLIDREIGGSLDNQDARNDFQQAEIETGSDGMEYLQTWTTTAWKPAHGPVEKLCEKFKLSYLYFTEEPGNGIYETNDREGIYFPDRYVIEQYDAEPCYYQTEQEALDDISNRTGNICTDWESAQKIIGKHNKEQEDETITLIEIKLI